MASNYQVPASVARRLGYYVYLYVDPVDNRVFYVGKGKGSRALAHLDEALNPGVAKQIRAGGKEPRIEVLVHGLPDSKTALRVEAAAIDLLGVTNLENEVRGWRVGSYGRMPLEELVAHYSQRRVEIREPAILIRINRLYRYGMSDVELYDATRSAWKLGERRDAARLAFSVFEGVVREVYQITGWMPRGSTFNTRRAGRGVEAEDRWEFVGVVAEDSVRKRYVNGYVGHYFAHGAQNPISYVNL